MAIFLLFNSNYNIEIHKRPIKDGIVRIGNKEWYVDNVKPFMVKKPFGEEQLYMLNWKSLIPMGPKDFNVVETSLTPELLKRIPELKIFNFLLKRFKTEGTQNIWLPLALGLVAGAFLIYGLIAFRILPMV